MSSEYGPYLSLQSITYSEPVSIDAMLNEWDSPYKGGDKAFAYYKAEIGIERNTWHLGVLNRLDYFMTFSEQTAQLYYYTKNHLPLEAGKSYALNIDVLHEYSRGLRFGFERQLLQNVNAGIAVSYLEGLKLTDGTINGNAMVTADNDYDFQFDVDYAYSRDTLFEREVSAPHGKGYSVDMELDWQVSEKFASHLTVLDMLGQIVWDNAPYTTATASSATKTYDADGYVRYQPLATGLESNKNFKQRLPRKIFADISYSLNRKMNVLAEVQDYKIARFASVGAGWRWPGRGEFQSLYNLTAKALILRYQRNKLRLEVGSDNFWIRRRESYFSLLLSYAAGF